jgi:hypothetical protein
MAKNYLENLLGDGERILLATRQHWFILASSIFFEIIITLIVFGGTIIATIFAPDQANYHDHRLLLAAHPPHQHDQ